MPRLLDLFCGAGGAAKGYYNAGFEVVGIDICPQPHYPFEFHQADAMTFPLHRFDAIHASPPCYRYTNMSYVHADRLHTYPDLIEPTRDRLVFAGVPYVIENVPGAPLINPVRLCGSMFGLGCDGGQLRRHRLFECNFHAGRPNCNHDPSLITVGVYGGSHSDARQYVPDNGLCREVMGIPWMTGKELRQAIPPAYTEWIGLWLRMAIA